ncbi:MAG TPA: hypothetical protein VF933_03455, partial [Streptosporangiaceae bacterium]
VRYNEATSWPVAAGHGCVGCSEPHFWDTMSPFYDRLPHVDTADFEVTADRLGLTIVAATAAGFAAHGVGKAIQHRVGAARDTRAARAGATPEVNMSRGRKTAGNGNALPGSNEDYQSGGHYDGFDSEQDGG